MLHEVSKTRDLLPMIIIGSSSVKYKIKQKIPTKEIS